MLAVRAVDGRASADRELFERSLADGAFFTGTPVHLVLQLKEATNAIGIDIIRHRGSAELDGLRQHLLQRGVQASKLIAREAARRSARTNACTEESLICVDVADAVQDRLVQQRGLDRDLAATEELRELIRGDGGGLPAWSGIAVPVFAAERDDREPTEPARIDEANLALIGQREHGVCVGGQRDIRL